MATRDGSTDPEALEAEVLAALMGARTDLERVRVVLTDRERGATGSREVLDVVASHWREHGAAHRTVWRLVGEEVRGALLTQLHGWKRQLREQLDTRDVEQPAGDDGAIDAPMENLRARLSDAGSGLDRTELLIELAELHASRDDHPEAEALFRTAEQELAPYRDRATGSGIAEALLASLPAMVRGEADEARAEIEPLVRVSRLLQRVYEGLIQVATEADEVRRYVERKQALEESLARDPQDDLELKRRLMEELSERLGGSASAGEQEGSGGGDGPTP
jgi:hypothetical protein